MNEGKLIQHSDRINFRELLDSHLKDGWSVVPGTMTASGMKADDYFGVVVEREPMDDDQLVDLISRTNLDVINDIVSKDRESLTDDEYKIIQELSAP